MSKIRTMLIGAALTAFATSAAFAQTGVATQGSAGAGVQAQAPAAGVGAGVQGGAGANASGNAAGGATDAHAAGRVTVEGVRFDGVLRVTDAGLFRAAVEAGVGPGRAYGFGLLSFRAIR